MYAALLVVSSLSTTSAQRVNVLGYLEHQVYPQDLGGNVVVMDYSKARLDLGADPFDWLALSADAVGQMQHGKTRFSSLDFIPSSVVETHATAVGMSAKELEDDYRFRWKNELYVDNAFASLYLANITVRAGRQQLSRGSGYAWNPTDIFQDKNVLDPMYEKRGADAVMVSVPTSALGSVTAAVGLERAWSRAKKALRWRSHVSGFDITLSAMETHWQEVDFVLGESSLRQRRLLAADFSGTVGEFGTWFEGAFSDVQNGDNYAELLLGLDHTTESGLYLMAEFYHNGKGAAGRNRYDFNGWMRLLADSGEQLGRDYLFLGQSYPLSDLVNGSGYVILNLTDGSVVAYPYLEYSLSDNALLTLIGYLTAGKDGSEFGSFGSGAILRARLYF